LFLFPFLLLCFLLAEATQVVSWWGAAVLGVSLTEVYLDVLFLFDFFGARSVFFGWVSLDTRPSVVVIGFR